MNKQEMAEWLAENVLNLPKVEGNYFVPLQFSKRTDYLTAFIYSPDGFFAVWDAVEKKGNLGLDFWEEFNLKVGGGKDRFEAFYNAVYEAMK